MQQEARTHLLTKGKKEWLTPNDLFEEFEFSKSSQAKMRMKRIIPFVKVGGFVRYSRTELEIWMRSNRVKMSVA